MSAPGVSVVIPCYNAERYVGGSIQSALDQSFRPHEIIVIDDGSTDDSLSRIKNFGDAVRWETGPNRGACAARNRGLELATGNLIQFLDADDFLHPEKLKLMVPLVDLRRREIVFCDGVRVDTERGTYFNPLRVPIEGIDPVVYVARNRGLQTPAPLHQTGLLREVGGFVAALPCAQELDLHMRMVCNGISLKRLDRVLYFVRRLPGSVSSNSPRIYKQYLGIVDRASRILAARDALTTERGNALAQMLAQAARRLARAGEFRQARRFLAVAKIVGRKWRLSDAYSGRAKCIAPRIGLVGTELLTMLDEWLRQTLGLADPSANPAVEFCDQDGNLL